MIRALYENNLLNLQDSKKADKYCINELIGQFLIFFTAGTDSTSNTVNVALHYLANDKQS